LAVYALGEQHGTPALLAAMARADDAGTYSADALALLLAVPCPAPAMPQQLRLAALPSQVEVDRRLSVYEAWVHVDIALPLEPGEAGEPRDGTISIEGARAEVAR